MTYSWIHLAPSGPWEYTKQMQERKRGGGGCCEGRSDARQRQSRYVRTVVAGQIEENIDIYEGEQDGENLTLVT